MSSNTYLTETAVDKLENDTSKTRIYRGVRRLIIMGHLKPGERLDVEELAER